MTFKVNVALVFTADSKDEASDKASNALSLIPAQDAAVLYEINDITEE